MKLSKKFYCELCGICVPTVEKSDFSDDLNTNPFEIDFKCENCVKIVTSYRTINENSNDSTNNLHSLPKKTVFFHLNEDIIDDDSRFNDLLRYSHKNVLIIGCGSVKRSMVLMSLKKFKFKRLVNLIRKQSWTNDFFDDIIYSEHEDIEKKEETLKIIENYMNENDCIFDAIFTFDDYSVLLTSYITTQLGYPGIPYDICKSIKDKHKFRELSFQLGITCPNFNFLTHNYRKDHLEKIEIFLEEIGNFNEAEQAKLKEKFLYALTKINGSFVVKNSYGSGKDFVRKCNKLDDYRRCLYDSIRSSSTMDLVVEEYYDGHEIDIDILVQNNECVFMGISDNFAAQEPFFFERGGVTPSLELDSDEQELIRKLVYEWIKKLNIQNACLHFEAKCRPKSLYRQDRFTPDKFLMPIEINLRLGGAEVYTMNLSAYGVNLFLENLDIALSIKLDKERLYFRQENPRFNCISYDYHPAKNVLIKDIQLNMKQIQENMNLIEIAIFRTVGDLLGIKDYVGWITVKSHKNASIQELIQLKEKIMELIKFDYIEII
jgi:hypothetical protein